MMSFKFICSEHRFISPWRNRCLLISLAVTYSYASRALLQAWNHPVNSWRHFLSSPTITRSALVSPILMVCRHLIIVIHIIIEAGRYGACVTGSRGLLKLSANGGIRAISKWRYFVCGPRNTPRPNAMTSSTRRKQVNHFPGRSVFLLCSASSYGAVLPPNRRSLCLLTRLPFAEKFARENQSACSRRNRHQTHADHWRRCCMRPAVMMMKPVLSRRRHDGRQKREQTEYQVNSVSHAMLRVPYCMLCYC